MLREIAAATFSRGSLLQCHERLIYATSSQVCTYNLVMCPYALLSHSTGMRCAKQYVALANSLATRVSPPVSDPWQSLNGLKNNSAARDEASTSKLQSNEQQTKPIHQILPAKANHMTTANTITVVGDGPDPAGDGPGPARRCFNNDCGATALYSYINA